MTWIDEAKKRDPMESAKKYVELMKDYDINKDYTDAELMCELDILWYAAMQDENAEKMVKNIRKNN